VDVFISIDMEGVAGVTTLRQTYRGTDLSSSAIADLRYELSFRIPETKAEPIRGRRGPGPESSA
jgi:hypothetical protein